MLGMYLDIGQEKEKEQTEKMLKMPRCFRLLERRARSERARPSAGPVQRQALSGATGVWARRGSGYFSNGREWVRGAGCYGVRIRCMKCEVILGER